jgi:V/A-type H+-transporting ATPase subunit I
MPGRYEVDPSATLAVVVPLLFGYMFGDLGQGLVLAGLGWLLRRRFSIARLLVPAGIMAAVFGLVFGSVFSREDLLPALWVHPLHAPVTVLAVPLVFAVVLLAGGQVLNAFEAAWRGELRHWWLADGGFLPLYLGAAASLLEPDFLALAVAGAAWVVLGRFALQPTLVGAAGAVGGLLEDGMRLLVNTISFARVGAFALAHAGLSAAVVTLADAAHGLLVPGLVMVLGNLMILALETLVVSVQTTRLILFEFFARFLKAEGRRFRPLPPPPAFLDGDPHETKS